VGPGVEAHGAAKIALARDREHAQKLAGGAGALAITEDPLVHDGRLLVEARIAPAPVRGRIVAAIGVGSAPDWKGVAGLVGEIAGEVGRGRLEARVSG
jgi:hypothetical protein